MSTVRKAVVDVWGGLLGSSIESPEANFFDLGGDSLMMMNMLAEIESKLGLEISPGEVFDNPTFGSFCDHLEEELGRTTAKRV